jgi:hypothetical protein
MVKVLVPVELQYSEPIADIVLRALQAFRLATKDEPDLHKHYAQESWKCEKRERKAVQRWVSLPKNWEKALALPRWRRYLTAALIYMLDQRGEKKK